MTRGVSGRRGERDNVTKEDLATTRVKKEDLNHESKESKEENKAESTEQSQDRKEKSKKEEVIKTVKENKESKYYRTLGAVAEEVLENLSPKGKAVLDLMVKYATMANPNVMLSEENKILAPCTLLRLLVALESLEAVEPEQVSILQTVLKVNTVNEGKLGIFNDIYIKRKTFNFGALNREDLERLNELSTKYLG